MSMILIGDQESIIEPIVLFFSHLKVGSQWGREILIHFIQDHFITQEFVNTQLKINPINPGLVYTADYYG